MAPIRVLVVLSVLLCSLAASPRADVPQSRKVALMIGISEYADKGLPSLPAAHSDAKRMESALRENAYSTTLLLNDHATRESILKTLARLVEHAGKDDTILLLFSGHGMQIEDEHYLVAYNTVPTISSLRMTAVALSEIRRVLAPFRGKSLVIIDTCRASYRIDHSGFVPSYVEPSLRLKASTDPLIFFATSQNGAAYEATDGGIFTTALLEALSGKAADARGRITVADLESFVQSAVSTRARALRIDQRPQLTGGSIIDFVIASRKTQRLDATMVSAPSNLAESIGPANPPPLSSAPLPLTSTRAKPAPFESTGPKNTIPSNSLVTNNALLSGTKYAGSELSPQSPIRAYHVAQPFATIPSVPQPGFFDMTSYLRTPVGPQSPSWSAQTAPIWCSGVSPGPTVHNVLCQRVTDCPPVEAPIRALTTYSELERHEMMRVWDYARMINNPAGFRLFCAAYPETIYCAVTGVGTTPGSPPTPILHVKGYTPYNASPSELTDKMSAFFFGVVFISIVIVIALFIPNPTGAQWFILRVVLALSAAGIGAVVPGLIAIDVNPYIRAGGAITLFVIIFRFNPPKLLQRTKSQSTGPRDITRSPSHR